jgi:hypothetical protein
MLIVAMLVVALNHTAYRGWASTRIALLIQTERLASIQKVREKIHPLDGVRQGRNAQGWT